MRLFGLEKKNEVTRREDRYRPAKEYLSTEGDGKSLRQERPRGFGGKGKGSQKGPQRA